MLRVVGFLCRVRVVCCLIVCVFVVVVFVVVDVGVGVGVGSLLFVVFGCLLLFHVRC